MSKGVKKAFVVVAALAVTVLVAGIGTGDAQQKKNYSFVSSNPGGTWYNMVGGAIGLYNKEIPGVNFSVEATGGSVENVRRVATGEAEFGMAYFSHMADAWNGQGNYKGRQLHDIRSLCEVTVSDHYFVTLKSKNIKSLKDLAGKKVAIGAPGSGTSDNSRNILNALGIKVEPTELSFANAARALQDGKIDALGQGGSPAAGVVELAASQDILIIPYSDAEIAQIIKTMPSYSKAVMMANTYRGQDRAVPTVEFHVAMIAHKSVSDQVAYDVLKTTFNKDGRRFLEAVHSQWKDLKNNPNLVKMTSVPLHPGAEKYWKEQGKK
ncbi:MAG: TAXI family TRAP transporter solute-binding subunit [Deltaproteobacteria bacterium]|nr:TAXI family TRAP transporter solute-binding subunit [Deltaproteobacteria bacterium]